MPKYCSKCGTDNLDTATVCRNCGSALGGSGYQPVQPYQQGYPAQSSEELKRLGAEKKLVAGICGILIGGFGVHKFILGYTTEGIIQIAITIVTCGAGAIIGLIEGILYLTKSDEEFARTYILSKRGWF